MIRPSRAIMLAGTLRPSPLREELDLHVLCLPLGPEGTLLDAWLNALRAIPGLRDVLVVVNSDRDVDMVDRTTPSEPAGGEDGLIVRTAVEPAAWRGVGGILRDVTDDLDDDAVIIAIEAHTLPPPALEPLLDAFKNDATPLIDGAVGVCEPDEPAGVYAFTRRALKLVPAIGYHDVKEQSLPLMYERGMKVGAAQLPGQARRVRDRKGYLDAVRFSLPAEDNNEPALHISPLTSVSDDAVLDGFCIVEPGAMILDGAVVHESVILKGATIGRGAVVSRSIIGPLAVVPRDRRVVRDVVTEPGTAEGRKLLIMSERLIEKVA